MIDIGNIADVINVKSMVDMTDIGSIIDVINVRSITDVINIGNIVIKEYNKYNTLIV